MKKIVIYFNSMSPAGGIERVIANLANNWIENFEVTILTKDNKLSFYKLDNSIKTDDLNVNSKMDMSNRIKRIFSVFFNMFLVAYKLKSYFKHNEVDYIYIATPMNAFEIYLASHKLLRKSVVAEHASYFGYNRVYNIIKKFIYPKARIIATPTTMDHKIYIKKGYNSVYIPHLSTFPAVRNNSSQRIALSVGRLTADKRQLDLLKIWKNFKVVDENNWKLIIVGQGELENELIKFIKLNQLNDSVKLISPTSDVEEIYKQASLFLFSSKYEGFGMVLLEAMSFGLPCISYDIPSGPKDIVKNGQNGFLIANNDCTEFVKKISLLTSDKKLLNAMKEEAYQTANSWDNPFILNLWYDKVFI